MEKRCTLPQMLASSSSTLIYSHVELVINFIHTVHIWICGIQSYYCLAFKNSPNKYLSGQHKKPELLNFIEILYWTIVHRVFLDKVQCVFFCWCISNPFLEGVIKCVFGLYNCKKSAISFQLNVCKCKMKRIPSNRYSNSKFVYHES